MFCSSLDNLLKSMVFKQDKSALSLMLLQTFSNLYLGEYLTNLNCSSLDSVFSSSDSGGATYFFLSFGSVSHPCFVSFCFPYAFATWVVSLVSVLVVGLVELNFVSFFFPLQLTTRHALGFYLASEGNMTTLVKA